MTVIKSNDFFFQNIKSVIFDFDGTIADTVGIHELAFVKTLQKYNLRFSYTDYLGQTTAKAIEQIFAHNNLQLNSTELQLLVATKRQIANEIIQTHSKFIDGAFDFILLLDSKNIPMYIASSGSKKNVKDGITALKINKYFKGIITADDIQNSKPDPEIFNKVVELYKLDKSKTLVIEDALSGIEAALAANLQVVCINPALETDKFLSSNALKISFEQLIRCFNT